MPMPSSLRSRRAGVLWLLATLTGGTALMYVRSHVYFPGDAAATSGAILSDALRFRFAIVGALLSQLAMLFLALELYRVFAPVERVLARVLLISMVISVALACANQLPNLVALLWLGPEPYLQAFPREQRETLVLMLPRVLGVLPSLIGTGFAVNLLDKRLLPQFHPSLFTQLSMGLGALGGLPT